MLGSPEKFVFDTAMRNNGVGRHATNAEDVLIVHYSRTILMVLLAMFVVSVPAAAVAQTPLSDQYMTDEAVPGTAGGGGPAVGGEVPVDVKSISSASADKLPFTGGQIALIALLGVGLVALGVAGVATTRRRGSSTAS